MTVSASVVAHSKSADARDLFTIVAEYPRFVHPEVLTHRVLNRNASSSRAIPTKRMHENIRRDPALPESIRMNEPGMQGYTVADEETTAKALELIARHREVSIEIAEALDALGIHKQTVNRYTEAHQHIRVVITASQWDNFDWLRQHHMADPTMDALAREIYRARSESEGKILQPGEWHLPFILESDYAEAEQMENRIGLPMMEILRRMSAARCARVSYNNFDGKRPTIEADLALFDKLITREAEGIFLDPLHASPVEHQATPDRYHRRIMKWDRPELHGNLRGWVQYRKTIPNESMEGTPWQSPS